MQTIKHITKVYTRTYSDNGQVITYVEFEDERGEAGRLQGNDTNPHMRAVLDRAKRLGIEHTHETW